MSSIVPKTAILIDQADGPTERDFQTKISRPIRGDRGATTLGPRNIPIELENPDLVASPSTDAGTVPNLKFSFAAARNRITPGGWGHEVTARELPVAPFGARNASQFLAVFLAIGS